MKKKIKDLTFAETKRICNNTLRCSSCPLFSTEENILCVLSDPLVFITSTYWEREVEVPEEPVGNTDQLEKKE